MSAAPRLVVYTSFYGTMEPLNADVFGGFTSCDRMIFTDNRDMVINGAVDGPLDGVHVVNDPLDGLDPARASRRAKLMPHRYLSEYDWSLYLDNNSYLKVDPLEVFARMRALGDAAFYAFPHPHRDCVYREGREVIEMGKDSRARVTARLRDYQEMGVPRHMGLITGNILLRQHGLPALQRFGERWYEQVLAYSRRDQLSFPVLRDMLGLDLRMITEFQMGDVVHHNVFQDGQRRSDITASAMDRAMLRLRRIKRDLVRALRQRG